MGKPTSSADCCRDCPNAIVAGDLNTPHESSVYRDNFGRLTNAFNTTGWGSTCTFFSAYTWLQLDNILSTAAWTPRACWIEGPVGGEHRPVVAELESVAP